MASTALANAKKEMMAQLEGIQNTIQRPTGFHISTRGKMFTLPDGKSSPGPMRVITLDYINYHSYYTAAFSSSDFAAPVCWAMNRNVAELAPSENVPNPQSDSCEKCPMNQYGSHPQGKGKACRNSVRIAVTVPENLSLDSPIMLLSINPKAIKGWGNYVRTVVEQFEVPPIGVTTEISFNPNETYPWVMFGDPQPHKEIEIAMALQKKAQEILLSEPSAD